MQLSKNVIITSFYGYKVSAIRVNSNIFFSIEHFLPSNGNIYKSMLYADIVNVIRRNEQDTG